MKLQSLQEAGFMAGVAASLELKEGELGFIGGMEIPAVQKFNWGFQQGVKYANDNLGTKMSLKAENVVYQGSFDNVAAGQQLAATMYDNGVKAIFTAAGGVGVGAINEAKAIDTATFNIIKDELDGKFPGGQTLTFDAKTGGVGIPEENPNLSKETQDKVAEVFNQIKDGKITISDKQGDLIK